MILMTTPCMYATFHDIQYRAYDFELSDPHKKKQQHKSTVKAVYYDIITILWP